MYLGSFEKMTLLKRLRHTPHYAFRLLTRSLALGTHTVIVTKYSSTRGVDKIHVHLRMSEVPLSAFTALYNKWDNVTVTIMFISAETF